VYFLLVVNRVFFGRLTQTLAKLEPVLLIEKLPALVLIVPIFILGLQPSWMVRWSEVEATALIKTDQQITIAKAKSEQNQDFETNFISANEIGISEQITSN